jgi:Ca-activated chloride channel family protein
MWSLDFPLTLLAVSIVPVLIYLVHFRRSRGGKLSFNFSIWGTEPIRFPGTPKRLLLLLSRILFWTGFCLLVVALSGPVLIEKRRNYLTRGLDLIIALDVSPSMSARDVGAATRFEAAREVIRGFAAGRENDSIGLVAFGREAALRVPPTLDHGFLFEVLDTLQVMELGDGTSIGTGIALAALHLRDSGSSEKVIVLVTDGDNNAGEISPERATEVAVALGIRIYTIGIGSEGETTLEFTDPESGRQVRGVYQGKLNEELLRQMAAVSGGRYFHSGTLGILNTVFQEIDSLESRRQEVVVFVERLPRQGIFILTGLLIIVACVLINKLMIGELL